MNIVPASVTDAPAIVELLTGWKAAQNSELHRELCEYAAAVFFEHPWADPEIVPLVARNDDGTIDGFLAMTARDYVLGDRRIRVAISSNFKVRTDDSRPPNPLLALKLIRTALRGPQDVTIADGATDTSRKIWQSCNGDVAKLLSFDFMRPLRPAAAMSALALGEADLGRFTTGILRGAARVADVLIRPIVRRFEPAARAGISCREYSSVASLNLIQELPANSLHPSYDQANYDWLIERLAARFVPGSVVGRTVSDQDGRRLGWFLLGEKSPGIADIAQIGSADGRIADVFDAALAFASQQKLTMLRGPVTTDLMPLLRSRRCFLNTGRWFLFHSKDPELSRRIQDGSIFLHMLDGERWMLEFDKVRPS